MKCWKLATLVVAIVSAVLIMGLVLSITPRAPRTVKLEWQVYTQVTWTTENDFENNAAGTGDPTTRFQVDIASNPGDVKISVYPGHWDNLANINSIVGYGGSLCWTGGDNIYAYGVGAANSAEFSLYSISQDTWYSSKPLPAGVCKYVGKGLVWTGGDNIYAIHSTSTDFWLFSIKDNTWYNSAPAPANFEDGGSLIWTGGDNIYALRGRDGNQDNFWLFSIKDNKWYEMPSTPGTISYGGSLTWDNGNYIYALRGNSKNFYRFSISDNAWESLADIPASVYYGGALEWAGGDYIYAWPGGDSTSFYRYSISENTWESMPSTYAAVRQGGSLVWTGGNWIYATRGNNTGIFWRYSLTAWDDMAEPPAAWDYSAGLLWTGDNIYALQGNNRAGFYHYSISGKSWTSLTNTPSQFTYGACMAWTGGDNIYVSRGGDYLDFWLYSISADKWYDSADPPNGTGWGSDMVWTGGDNIYMTRGGNNPNFYRFSIKDNVWYTYPSTPANVSYGGSLTWDNGNYIYALCGGDAKNFWRFSIKDNAWEYLADVPETAHAHSAIEWTGGNFIYAIQTNNNKAKVYRFSISDNAWEHIPQDPSSYFDFGGQVLAWTGSDSLYFISSSTSTQFDRFLRYRLPSYYTSGTIGETGIGLRVNSGVTSQWNSLNWTASGISSTYTVQLQVRTSDTFGSGNYVNPENNDTGSWHTISSGTSGNITFSSSIPSSKTLEIRVKLNGDGINTPTLSSLMLDYTLVTVKLSPPTPSSPENESGTMDNTPELGWEEVDGATGYTIQISTRENFDNVDGATIENTSSENRITLGELAEDRYYWRVRATATTLGVENSDWSGVQNFWVDRTSPSLLAFTINSGASETTSSTVTLTLSADDGGSGVHRMRFRNEDESWSSWEPYSASKSWTLSSGDGSKTVYAMVCDRAHNESAVMSDDITKTSPPSPGGGGGGGGGGAPPPPDTIPPTLEVLEPTSANVSENVMMRVRITDPSGIDPSSISVTLDGGLAPHTWADGVVTSSFVALSPGGHLVVVRVKDASSNHNEASVNISFNVMSPSVVENVENTMPEPTGVYTIVIDTIDAGENATASFDDEKLPVWSITLVASEDIVVIEDVRVSMQVLENAPQSVRSLPENVIIYAYLVVSTTAPENALASATINFKVAKAWLQASNTSPMAIALFRLENDMWVELPTTKLSEDEFDVYYSAITPGFSVFVIGGRMVFPTFSLQLPATPLEPENGFVQIMLLVVNPTSNQIVKQCELRFDSYVKLFEIEVPPYENLLVAVYVSVGGMEPGTYDMKLYDAETNTVLDEGRATLLGITEPETPPAIVTPTPSPVLPIIAIALTMIAGLGMLRVTRRLPKSGAKLPNAKMLKLKHPTTNTEHSLKAKKVGKEPSRERPPMIHGHHEIPTPAAHEFLSEESPVVQEYCDLLSSAAYEIVAKGKVKHLGRAVKPYKRKNVGED